MNEISLAESTVIEKVQVENYKEIKPQMGMSVKDAKEYWDNLFDRSENQLEKIKCRNEELAGQKHPDTQVPFEKKIIESEGQEYEVVVPEFESVFDVYLSSDKLTATDRVQFKECNEQLKEAVSLDKDLHDKFTAEQLEQIENGDTPEGCVWHHDAEVGKIQLVDFEIHTRTAHTGGRAIWGGGNQNRR